MCCLGQEAGVGAQLRVLRGHRAGGSMGGVGVPCRVNQEQDGTKSPCFILVLAFAFNQLLWIPNFVCKRTKRKTVREVAMLRDPETKGQRSARFLLRDQRILQHSETPRAGFWEKGITMNHH